MELTTSGLVWRNWADVELCFRGSLGEVQRTVAVVSKMQRDERIDNTVSSRKIVSFATQGLSASKAESRLPSLVSSHHVIAGGSSINC